MADTLGSAAAKLERFAVELERDVARQSALDTAKQAEQFAREEAAADVGSDRAFSGWRRSNGIVLDTRTKEVRPGVVLFTPTKESAGPWTVAESGRNRGNAGGFAGPGANRKTGATGRTKSGALRKVRRFKAKRWNGYTDPKGTAGRVVDRIEEAHPKTVQRRVDRAVNTVDRG